MSPKPRALRKLSKTKRCIVLPPSLQCKEGKKNTNKNKSQIKTTPRCQRNKTKKKHRPFVALVFGADEQRISVVETLAAARRRVDSHFTPRRKSGKKHQAQTNERTRCERLSTDPTSSAQRSDARRETENHDDDDEHHNDALTILSANASN